MRRAPKKGAGDQALGRSRGGLSTKVHLLVDNKGRPLVVVVSPGQAGDNPALIPMLDHGSPAAARADHAPTRTGARRPMIEKAYSLAPAAPTCADAASRPSSPNPPTRPPTANAAAHAAAAP